MSGGNGLLGMSLAAPVLADTVQRVRPGSVALAFDGAASPTPRLPSTRPIDHRWDRSRGIIFSNARRTIARDHTWSSTHGIIFGNIPAPTRYYAINPAFGRKKPPASEPHPAASNSSNNATIVGSSVDNVHRGFDLGMNRVEGTKLRNDNTKLQQDVKDRDAKIEELKRLESMQQEQMKQMVADFEAQKSRLEKKRTAEKVKIQEELNAQKKLVADAEPSLKNLEKHRATARDEGRREAEAELRRRHEGEIEELKASHARQIATAEENSQVMVAAKRQNGVLVAQHERERREHADAIKKAQAAVESAEAEAKEHKQNSHYLQQQYLGRQRRGKTDRDNYTNYRNVFDDVTEAAYQTMKQLMLLARQLDSESQLWRKSASTFQNTKHLHLFRQTSKHNAIKKSINEFLEERSAHAAHGSEQLEALSTQLRADVQAFKGSAHNSRTLTRLLHYNDEQTAFSLTDATYLFAMVQPFRQRRDECENRIAQIQAETSRSGQSRRDVDRTLEQELILLRERRKALNRLLQVFEIMRKLRAYEALLQDNPVEKAVFMRTIKAFEDVDKVQDNFLNLFDEMQASSDESSTSLRERLRLRSTYRDDEGKARKALDELQELARSRCILEQELGQLTPTEQLEADREITARINRLIGQQNDLIDTLVPSMGSIGRRTRASFTSPSKPMTPEDLQAKLAGTLSGAKPKKPAPSTTLKDAIKTPQRRRTREQITMVFEEAIRKKKRIFMQHTDRGAAESVEHDDTSDIVAVSRSMTRLAPRVHPAGAKQSMDMWQSLLKQFHLRRKSLALLPNVEAGLVEAFDEPMANIASKIAVLNSGIKAGRADSGVPEEGATGNEDSGKEGSGKGSSGNGGSSIGDSSNGASGMNHDQAGGKMSDQTSVAEFVGTAGSAELSKAEPKGDRDMAREPGSSDVHSGNGYNRLRIIAEGRKPKSRRQRLTVRKHAVDSNGPNQMASLLASLEAKSGSVSDGTSASASSGGLNLKPTGSKRAQHSLLPSTSFDVRAFHRSTTFSRGVFTTAISSADSLSHLKESELRALDEAFSTMSAEPTGLATPRESMPSNNDSPAHASRNRNEVSTMATSTAADDNVEDHASEYSPSIASSVDSAGTSTSGLPTVESTDVNVELAYKIPVQDFRAAVMASSNSTAAFWSHRLYKGADGKQPAVFYCKSFDVAERQARLFVGEKVLGFDLEWEPQTSIKTGNIKRNVSLIQIAAEDKIALFQIALFKGETAEELMPPTLKTILESADVVKAGVNVVGDARRMRELLNIEMKGVFELSHMYRVVKYSENEPKNVSFKLTSLATQVQDILMLPLRKDDNRVSAWSRDLNTQQTDYAASDAYAGFRLFHKLDEMRRAMSPMPPRPGFLEQELPLTLGDGSKVYKSTWKASERKTAAAASKSVDAEEEEDEFFDAIEEQDAEDLTAKMESLDITQDDGAVASTVTYPTLPQMDAEDDAGIPAATTTGEVTQNEAQQPRIESSRQQSRPDTAELRAADTWVAEWRFSLPPDWTVSARPSELRAYHLWHHQGFGLKEVAALCREPPLALTTVASYVMQALKEENLPYDPERVRGPRDILPTSVHRRYQKIFDRIPK